MKIINLMEDTKGVEGCVYEHGLSFYIETDLHKILVDTGAGADFLKNASLLGIDLQKVDTVILSHGHYDHSGGILSFARMNPDAKIYMQTSAGEDYYHPSKKEDRYIGIDKKIPELPQCVKIQGELKIDEELFLFSDIRGRRFWPQSNLQLKRKEGKTYIQDDFSHEQCLVLTHKGRKILLSGCAHNGILNILDRYQECVQGIPDMVISGFHMMKKTSYSEEEILNIQNTAKELKKTNTIFYTGHCTGHTAFEIMHEIMGEQIREFHCGETLIE